MCFEGGSERELHGWETNLYRDGGWRTKEGGLTWAVDPDPGLATIYSLIYIF